MNWLNIFLLASVETIGDFSLKEYANRGHTLYLINGILGYASVVAFLIKSLRRSTVLMVNNQWDGMSSLIESAAAYIFLGERFQYASQYIGILFILAGMFLIDGTYHFYHLV
jgi:multidrug transporter EmrE-like cation transporter